MVGDSYGAEGPLDSTHLRFCNVGCEIGVVGSETQLPGLRLLRDGRDGR